MIVREDNEEKRRKQKNEKTSIEIDLSPTFVSKISSGIPEGLAETSTDNNNQAETAMSIDQDADKDAEDQRHIDFTTLSESGQTSEEGDEDHPGMQLHSATMEKNKFNGGHYYC